MNKTSFHDWEIITDHGVFLRKSESFAINPVEFDKRTEGQYACHFNDFFLVCSKEKAEQTLQAVKSGETFFDFRTLQENKA